MKKMIFNLCTLACLTGFQAFSQTAGGGATGAAGAGAGANQNPGLNGAAGAAGANQGNTATTPAVPGRDQPPVAPNTRAPIVPGGPSNVTVGVNPGATNRLSSTNEFAFTNQSGTNITGTNNLGLGPNDVAVTEFDRTLIIRVRQTIIQRLGGTPTAWAPVTFNSQNAMVTILGVGPSVAIKQRVVAVVQTSPGVVRVIDRLAVDPNAVQISGTVARPLPPGFPPGDPRFGTNVNTNLPPTGRPVTPPRAFPNSNTPVTTP